MFTAAAMLAAMVGTAAAEAKMVLADSQQIPDNRTFRSGYAADSFEGKIFMNDIRGSKVSAK